eukprot:365746-Chlamydomonas_euryale.AAC.1
MAYVRVRVWPGGPGYLCMDAVVWTRTTHRTVQQAGERGDKRKRVTQAGMRVPALTYLRGIFGLCRTKGFPNPKP